MFATNLPKLERVIRIVLGLGLVAYGVIVMAQPDLIIAGTGIFIALTGVVGFCPACALVGRRRL